MASVPRPKQRRHERLFSAIDSAKVVIILCCRECVDVGGRKWQQEGRIRFHDLCCLQVFILLRGGTGHVNSTAEMRCT